MPRSLRLLVPLAVLLGVPSTGLAAPLPGPGSIELSPQLAAAPGTAGPLLVAASGHATASSPAGTRVWRSTNGASWTGPVTPTLDPPLSATDPVEDRGTPAVALSADGGFLALQASEVQGSVDRPCRSGSGIYVAPTTSAGVLAAAAELVVANTGARVRSRPTVAVDATGSGSRPLLAVERRACAGGPPSVEAWSLDEGTGSYEAALEVSNAEGPVLAGNGTATYLGFLRHGGGAAEIVVHRCARAAGRVTCDEAGATAPFTPVTALPDGGPDITSAPDLAVDAGGGLHLVWTASSGGDVDVLHSRSADGGVTWTAPHVVAGPAAGAAEFLPAVGVSPNADAAGRLRADVTFQVRLAGQTAAQPFQASTNGVTWGRTVALSGTAAVAPATIGGTPTFGERSDALSTAPVDAADGARGGRGVAVLGRGSDISYLPQTHGRTPPVLSGLGGALVTGKNQAVALAPPVASDDDGDPVTLTASAASGDASGGVYRPQPGFAGADAVRFTATDGYTGAAAAEQPVSVSNATPVVQIDARARTVPQGSTSRLQLTATDADAGDVLTWSLSSVPASLAGRVTLTPGGELTVDLPPGLRNVSPLAIGVQVSDTTPQVGGTALGTTFVKVEPVYGPVSVTTSARATGHTVQFSSVLRDEDVEATALAVRPAPVYLWTFGDGATPRTSSLPNPRVRYAPGSGTPRWTLSVTVFRTEGTSVTPTASGRVALTPEGRSLLAVDQRVDRRRGRLLVAVRSRATGTVQVDVRIRGRRVASRRVRLSAGPSATLGRTAGVAFPLRGLRARTVDLVVRYADGVPGPPPTAVRRKIRLR